MVVGVKNRMWRAKYSTYFVWKCEGCERTNLLPKHYQHPVPFEWLSSSVPNIGAHCLQCSTASLVVLVERDGTTVVCVYVVPEGSNDIEVCQETGKWYVEEVGDWYVERYQAIRGYLLKS